MKSIPRYLLVLAAAAALSACSSVKLDDQAPVESRSGAAVVPGNQNAARDAAANSQTRVAPVTASGGDMAGMGNVPRIVYFDFDSYVVKDEFRPVVEANAKVLTTNPSRKMAVQGHTDDRGSSEYNLALGQRRAEAVVKSLTLLGVKPSPGRGHQLRQGASGGAGRERGSVGQEPPRRADGRPVRATLALLRGAGASALAACALACAAGPGRHLRRRRGAPGHPRPAQAARAEQRAGARPPGRADGGHERQHRPAQAQPARPELADRDCSAPTTPGCAARSRSSRATSPSCRGSRPTSSRASTTASARSSRRR